MAGLLSIEEHDARRRVEQALASEAARKTGVACPKCGGELLWAAGPYLQHSVYPPPTMAPAICPPCGLEVRIER